jgi:hypothetical protein
MWTRTIPRLNWVKNFGAPMWRLETKYLRHVFVRLHTHDSWVLAKTGRVLWLWSRCWNFISCNTHRVVALSGYTVKKSVRPRFKRFQRLEQKTQISSLDLFSAHQRQSSGIQSRLPKDITLLAHSSSGSVTGTCICLAAQHVPRDYRSPGHRCDRPACH